MTSDRVQERLERDFPRADHAAAAALIERIAGELSFWKVVTQTDRVEYAALELAGGDLGRLEKAVALAMRDWRDLLVAAGDA